MKEQSMGYKFTYEEPIPTSRLVLRVANRLLLPKHLKSFFFLNISGAQKRTMEYGRRPFGVGLLVGGIDV